MQKGFRAKNLSGGYKHIPMRKHLKKADNADTTFLFNRRVSGLLLFTFSWRFT